MSEHVHGVDGRRSTRRRCVACLALSLVLWLPVVHLFYPADAEAVVRSPGVPQMATLMAARNLAMWEDGAAREREIGKMRRANAEWDFMERTYLVLSLANMALRDPSFAPRALAVTDRIVEETLALERRSFVVIHGGEL